MHRDYKQKDKLNTYNDRVQSLKVCKELLAKIRLVTYYQFIMDNDSIIMVRLTVIFQYHKFEVMRLLIPLNSHLKLHSTQSHIFV